VKVSPSSVWTRAFVICCDCVVVRKKQSKSCGKKKRSVFGVTIRLQGMSRFVTFTISVSHVLTYSTAKAKNLGQYSNRRMRGRDPKRPTEVEILRNLARNF
jgi:hypothetical protein